MKTTRIAGLLLVLLVPQGEGQEVIDQAPTFKTRVNLILVPVVVRDRDGRAVANLTREDFELFDRGKRQVISQFTVDTGGRARLTARPGAAPSEPARPRRFVAFVFDDIHLTSGDLTWVRDGVTRSLDTLGQDDRAAIFTTSGRTALEFTSDRAKLLDTVADLRPNPVSRPLGRQCPEVNHFIASQILGHEETTAKEAFRAIIRETFDCMRVPEIFLEDVKKQARSVMRHAVVAGEHETRVAGAALKQVVRRMGIAPGQRTVMLFSPGFLTFSNERAIADVVDLATRLNVVMHALDARGLVPSAVDSTMPLISDFRALQYKRQMVERGAEAERDVLAQAAEGTGGTFARNTNDIDRVLKDAVAAPEVVYLLGYSPRELVADGSYHRLQVRLKGHNYAVQARRGYYASAGVTDPAEAARREIEDAMFAPESIHDPAVEIQTEFMKPSATRAELGVLTRLDLQRIRLERADDRRSNDLTITACVFDQHGNYVAGQQKLLKLRLKSVPPAITVRSNFEVAPGMYAVRVVVRDRDGELLSAGSELLEIP